MAFGLPLLLCRGMVTAVCFGGVSFVWFCGKHLFLPMSTSGALCRTRSSEQIAQKNPRERLSSPSNGPLSSELICSAFTLGNGYRSAAVNARRANGAVQLLRRNGWVQPSGLLADEWRMVACMLFRPLSGPLFLGCAHGWLLFFLVGPLFMTGHIGLLLQSGLSTQLC